MDDPLSRLFQALSDPTRRGVLTRLLAGDATISALAAPLGMSLTAVSKHVGILEETGLVQVRKIGRDRWCRLETEELAPALVWLKTLGLDDAEWEEALERRLEDLGLAGTDQDGPPPFDRDGRNL
jgi:DNA-binding transcriptional ArsR family regulator